MLREFLERRKERKALQKWQRSPLGQALTAHVSQYLAYPRFASMEPEAKQELVTDFYREVELVLHSDNPFLKLRKAIANFGIAWAELQVLCLTEDEKRGAFYADCPYISGELHRYIDKAVPHVKLLDEAKWKDPARTVEYFIGLCNLRSGRCAFYLNGLNYVRMETKDHDPQKDWFRPFLQAMLIWDEDSLREKMGLPSLLPDKIDALKYSTFMNMVVNGAANPYYEWEKAWTKKPA